MKELKNLDNADLATVKSVNALSNILISLLLKLIFLSRLNGWLWAEISLPPLFPNPSYAPELINNRVKLTF